MPGLFRCMLDLYFVCGVGAAALWVAAGMLEELAGTA